MQTMQDNTWRKSLDRTRRAAFGQILRVLGQSDIPDSFWDELEGALIQSDLGVQASQLLTEELREFASREGIIKRSDLEKVLSELMLSSIEPYKPLFAPDGPTVILLIGVNGSGKTTAAARLGHYFQRQSKSVLFAAADTYRAAAVEQLKIWGDRLNIEVISSESGSDPAAVVYTACETAKARSNDILLIDTSGRMHTSHNLMAELEKIRRVCSRGINQAPHQTLLVIDATTGQNGLSQAKVFTDKIGVDGVILSKLDGSTRGGVGFAITRELQLPIAYVGTGETSTDLIPFDPLAYIQGLISVDNVT